MPGQTRVVEDTSASTLPSPPAPIFRLKQTLGGVGKGALCPAFSPGGRWLVCGDADGPIALRDAVTGDQFRTLKEVDGTATPLCFSPDGRLLAASGLTGRIVIKHTHDRGRAVFPEKTAVIVSQAIHAIEGDYLSEACLVERQGIDDAFGEKKLL